MPSPLTGSAGEHLVLYRLLSMGYIAALAPEGAPNIDIIVTDQNAKVLKTIQVKTRKKGDDGGWHMREKHESLKSNRLFYCFVDLSLEEIKRPDVYMVPSKVVAWIIKKAQEIYLKTLGRNDRPRKNTKFRRLLPDYSKILELSERHRLYKEMGPGWMERYKNNWELLKQK